MTLLPGDVARRWASCKEEFANLTNEDSDQPELEPEEQTDEEKAHAAWSASAPTATRDTRPLRPGSQTCNHWANGRGHCSFGGSCHFRHDITPGFDEDKAWRARAPPAPKPKLLQGPSGYWKQSVHSDRRTDELFDEMAEVIDNTALGLRPGYAGGPPELAIDHPGGYDLTARLPHGVRRTVPEKTLHFPAGA